MKSYLLLEDGTILNGRIKSKLKNILGKFTLSDENTISIHCPLTNNTSLITSCEQVEKSFVISNMDFEYLKKKIKDSNVIQGKIVTDSLPIEYHVYDLKTFIPVNLK